MGISLNLGLARGLTWASLRHALRFQTRGRTTQAGGKSVRTASFMASLLSALVGCVLLLTAQAGSAANTQISGGFYHTLAIKDGNLWAWGYNIYGQLGDGTTTDRLTRVQIGTGFSAVSAGDYHTIALKPDGSLWAWGYNANGQLGDGTTINRSTPVQIGTGYSAIAAGGSHNVALKADGSMWAWGYNSLGQIGDGNDGTIPQRNSPVQIGAGFSAVAAGATHSIAVKADGSLWAWGNNLAGKLGDGTTSQRNSPVQVGTGFSTVLAAGTNNTFALKTDGSLWAWGYNGNGQVGDGTTTDRWTPVQIGTGFSAVSAGDGHTVALKTDGSPWTWGYDFWGQLGDGTTTSRNSPVQIVTGFSAIEAGYGHTIARKTDGSLWTWGYNYKGQLGDGTTTSRNTPTLIIPADTTLPSVPTGLTATASGANQINLSWTAATDNVGVTTYKLYRDGFLLVTLGNVTSYSDTGLFTATAYSYTVLACDATDNCSTQSSAVSATTGAAADTAAPAAPTGLTAAASGASQIDLAWTASTDNVGVTAYKLYRDGALLATLGNVTSHSDTGLTAATAYSYTVSACDAAGNCSAQSSAASATTGAATATLAGLALSCPATLASATAAVCTANASYSDGSSKSVTAAWTSSNATVAAIDASGQITAASVTVDTPVTISASFTENGVTRTANALVTVTAAAAQASNACTGTGKYLTGISIVGGAAKKAGDTLDVNYCLKNFSKVSRFDIYVAVQLPDNTLLYMKSAGFFNTPIFTSSVTPYLANTLIPDLSGPVLSIPELPLELPLGSYTFYAVPVLKGKSVQNTANWIGQISQGTFTLGW